MGLKAGLVLQCAAVAAAFAFPATNLPPGHMPGLARQASRWAAPSRQAAAAPDATAEAADVAAADVASSAANDSAGAPFKLGSAALRRQFPILAVDGGGAQPLVYLDSAATSQKPLAVLDAVDAYYREANANVHRGAHHLAALATQRYEAARDKVANFVGAARREEIVFTRGATEAINLVANTWGAANLGPGDEVILSVAEHHSNLVPWQLLAERQGVLLQFVQLDAEQRYDVAHFQALLGPRTKLVCLSHVSNVLGAVNPVEAVVALAHAAGAKVLVDACQSVPHMPVNVQSLGCDWLVASGHKMCAPTGIGFLWGRYALLDASPPWQGGGEMIDEVFLDHSTYAPPPGRFEAGTPAIAQAVGLGAACDFLTSLGMANVEAHERELGLYLWERLGDPALGGLKRLGPSPRALSLDAVGGAAQSVEEGGAAALGKAGGSHRTALVAFTHPHAHASDLAFFLDQEGVAVRAGHHCTQPLHRDVFRTSATCRASLYVHNSKADVDALIAALVTALNLLGADAGPGNDNDNDTKAE